MDKTACFMLTPDGIVYLPIHWSSQRKIDFFSGVAVAGVGDVWCLEKQASAHCFMFNLASRPDDLANRHLIGDGVRNFAKAGAAP